MNMRLSAFDIIDSLNGLADRERLGSKVDVLHLQSAQLADTQPRKEREQNAGCPPVHDKIQPLNEFAFLVLRESGDLMWHGGLGIFDERPVQKRDYAKLVGVFHRKTEYENDVMDRLHAHAAFTIKSPPLVKFKDVRLHIPLRDCPDPHFAEARNKMILRNQCEGRVSRWCDHRLLGLEPLSYQRFELYVGCHFIVPFVMFSFGSGQAPCKPVQYMLYYLQEVI